MLKKRFKLDKSRLVSNYFKHNFGQKKDKKGQITIFIILGFLFILALVLVILLEKEAVIFKPEEIIPTEKGKIENYITNCVEEIGGEALFKIGLTGGYIEVPRELLTDGSQHLKLAPEIVVPYWASGKSLRIPSLEEIKMRIDGEIEKNLKECLMGQKVFQETYDLIEKSEVTANTEIVDQKVIFNVRWNVEIRDKAGEIVTEVIDHLAESPIKLKRVYETAKAITESEMDELRFERLTIDLLSLEQSKVPLAGIEISCSKKKWSFTEAKETFKDMLRINVRELKLKGTDYVEFPDSLPYYQNHYIWEAGVNYPEIKVNFNYNNNFPFYFEATSREGDTMKSGMTGGSDILSYVCVQMWKFTYDVMYPILVEVIDETTGYVFHTVFTVHVKRNRPDRSGEFLTPSALMADFRGSEEYCGRKSIPITVYTYELIENNETGVYWREPLEGVNISYTCLKYKCDMGTTEYNFGGKGNVAAYKTIFPYCTGGILRGMRGGYKESWSRMVANEEKEAELNLIPVFRLPGDKIKVVKYKAKSLEEAKKGKIEKEGSLKGGEFASVKIVRKKEGEGHEGSMVISPDLDRSVLEQSYLEFLGKTDYKYNLEIFLIDDNGIKGGYKGEWLADWGELKSGKELTFKVLTKEKFSDELELFDFMGSLENYTSANQEELKPEFK